MIINAKTVKVPDSILRPGHLEGQSAKVRLALEAIEAYNDDELAWHLYADIPNDRYIEIIGFTWRERFRQPARRKKAVGDTLPGLG